MNLETLPQFSIRPCGENSEAFLEFGINNFHDAVKFIHRLPYGRNTDRSEYRLVLSERKGTCSTKHALLSCLCIEQGISEIMLYTGIYEMKESNTHVVGEVLQKYGLDCIPEAHCYLRYNGDMYDFTRDSTNHETITKFLTEIPIAPDQIGIFKIQFHRAYMPIWLNDYNLHRRFDPDGLWRIREECIKALSKV